ncbi:tyrosine-type recombinase/integrase [Labrys neptuniae]|uniref:Tyrosine-type recombinase/integrase n=1 Tax=Labrys neptuniae TaxID=376174 RepID=A0ABV3PIL4_9HYPH
MKISKRTVDAIVPTSARFVVWDTELSGFGVKVEPGGTKTFVVRYRAEGGGRNAPQRQYTLGRYGVLTPDEARKLAKQTLGGVATGDDPAGQLLAMRRAMTIAELGDLYLKEGVLLPTRRGGLKKPSSIAADRLAIEAHIKPLIGSHRVASLTSSDVERFLVDVAQGKSSRRRDPDMKPSRGAVPKGGESAATRAVRVLSAMISFARRRQVRPDNPCFGVAKFATGTVERFLTTDELDRLGTALREAETVGIVWEPDPSKKVKHAPKPENRIVRVCPYATAAIRLLLFTGARLREILHLQWSFVDMERGLLFLPESKTGKKTIILNAPALAVLDGLGRVGRFVIPGNNPDEPKTDLKRPWSMITRRARLDGLRIHDLRHTHASFGVGAGFGLPIVGKMLGHTQASTTQRYAHLDNDPVRRASESVGGTLAAALDGRTAKVAPRSAPHLSSPIMRRPLGLIARRR